MPCPFVNVAVISRMELGFHPKLLQLIVHAGHVDFLVGGTLLLSSCCTPSWISELCSCTTKLGILVVEAERVRLGPYEGDSMEAMNVHPKEHHEGY